MASTEHSAITMSERRLGYPFCVALQILELYWKVRAHALTGTKVLHTQIPLSTHKT